MKHETAEVDWTVLARFVAGESPPEEAGSVRRWLAADPARGELLTRLDRSTRLENAAPVDVEAALLKVKSRFRETEVTPLPSRASWHRTGFRAAAILMLLVGGSLLWRAIRAGRTAPLATRVYVTAPGRTDSIPLPDGGSALLGPGSRLTLAAGYGNSAREVALEGEALFDVPHNPALPFVVHAGGAAVRDLGTRFSVRSDPEGVRVVVVSGAVLLQDTTRGSPQSVALKAGELGVLGRDRQAPTRRPVQPQDELGWTRGHLVFDNASLGRVRDDLRRWFGIELIVADSSLASHHLKAEFTRESPREVLDVIALALGATIERRGDTAVLRSRKARPPSP